MLSNKKNKRGEIGKTITWIVSTLIIVGILILFIYISSGISNFKSLKSSDVFTNLSSNSQIFEMKTFIALKINNIDREKIEDTLKRNNEK